MLQNKQKSSLRCAIDLVRVNDSEYVTQLYELVGSLLNSKGNLVVIFFFFFFFFCSLSLPLFMLVLVTHIVAV